MGERGVIPFPDRDRQRRGMKPLRAPDGQPAKRLVLPPKAPSPPEGLSAAARGEWGRVAKQLEQAGVIAEIDRGVLTAYCTAWAHMMEAEKLLAEGGLTRTIKREGMEVTSKSSAWQIWREANRVMVSCAAQLYLTPTSRLRIPVPQGAKVADADGDDLFD